MPHEQGGGGPDQSDASGHHQARRVPPLSRTPPPPRCLRPCSIPQLLLDNVFKSPQDGLPLQLYTGACNTLFLFVAVSVAYGAVGGPTGAPRAAGPPLVWAAACRRAVGWELRRCFPCGIALSESVCVPTQGSTLVGQTARLPLVADAADSQVKDGPSGW
jgi:hypothetical protein